MPARPVRSSRKRRRRWTVATTVLGLAAWLAWRWLAAWGGASDEPGGHHEHGAHKHGTHSAHELAERRADVESLARPDGLWLDRIVEHDAELVLCGRAADLDAIADWVERLDRSRLFADVAVRQINGWHPPSFPGGPDYRFVVALSDVPLPRKRRWPMLRTPETATPSTVECVAAGTDRVHLDRLPELAVPSPEWRIAAPVEFRQTWLASARVEELEIVGVYRTSLGPVARVRSPRHDGVLAVRAGERLNDGEVAWIGFLSEKLAAVRLKQLVWPPGDGEPYREIERIVEWDAGSDPPWRRPAAATEEDGR